MRAKPVYVSRHARRRMRQHEIVFESVVSVIEQPERVAPSVRGRYNAFKKVASLYLRVTLREEEDRMVVVSVTPRRKPFRG